MKDKYSNMMKEQVFKVAEEHEPFSPDILSARIIALRKALGLTQKQMAKRLGMSQPAYLITEKKLGASGLKTIEKIARQLNCEVQVELKPLKPFDEMVRERAEVKAKSILDRTYGSMALEKQAPDKKSYAKRLKELTEELAGNPDSSLWED